MITLQYLRENPDEAKARIAKRSQKYIASIDEVLRLDEAARKAKTDMERNQAEANLLAKKVGELMKAGDKAGAENIKATTSSLKENVKVLEEEFRKLEQELFDVLVTIPNLPHASVPEGTTPEENLNVHEWGKIPELPEGALPHWDLIKKYDLIDF